jgi:ABC-type uncharacterized transport system substrate-binding protein
MRRRDFVGAVIGAAALPIMARAQQSNRIRRVGVLLNVSKDDLAAQSFVAAFRQALQELGWQEGRDVGIDVRWGAGNRERYRQHAAELVSLASEVIVAVSTDVVLSVQRASSAVPIVFVGVIDPVGSGLVGSMARPGGNAVLRCSNTRLAQNGSSCSRR